MKKIIAVDVHVLQAFNAPYCLNLNLLTELKTYINDPDYRVFIYITKPLPNPGLILKKLRQEKIIDSFLENHAHIVDFSIKKQRETVQAHIRELEENINQISEFIVVGLPHNQRFAWLQEMAASIVDWKASTELSLAEVLHNQLALGEPLPEMEISSSQNRQGNLNLNLLSRYKRELLTIPYPSVDPLPVEGCCKKVLAEMHVMKDLIEEENPFPEYLSLRNFHYVNLIFDGVHFLLEMGSVVCIIMHLYHSSHIESHIKKWAHTLEFQVADWLKKIENIVEGQDRSLLPTSTESRDEPTSGEINLSTATPGPSNAIESDAENLLAIGSFDTIIPIELNSSSELTKNNPLPCQEKLLDKSEGTIDRPILPETFQKKRGVSKQEVGMPDVSTRKKMSLEKKEGLCRSEQINRKVSLLPSSSVSLSSKFSISSVSSADSRLSVKSAPAFYISQSRLTQFSSSLQSEGKARSISLESFFLPSLQQQRLKSKSAVISKGLTFAKLKKTYNKTSKKFGSKKQVAQVTGSLVDISATDERSALIPKESVLIDYHATSVDQVTSQTSILIKPNTAVNQEDCSEEWVSARAKCAR